MKKYSLLAVSITVCMFVFSQKDPAARLYLDKVAEKSKSAEALSVEFEYNMTDLADEGMNFRQSGKAILSGNKYKIIMSDSEIYFNGEKLFNYIPAADEVTVSRPDPEYDDVFLSNPSRIFTLYTEDFKYRLLREFNESGRALVEIDLIPEDLDQSYSRIRLHIDKNMNEIVRAKLFEKMGTRYTIEFSNYQLLSNLDPGAFSFDTAAHPNADVIDMTGF
jgi:outer membrane lipoprotein-sorting protein